MILSIKLRDSGDAAFFKHRVQQDRIQLNPKNLSEVPVLAICVASILQLMAKTDASG